MYQKQTCNVVNGIAWVKSATAIKSINEFYIRSIYILSQLTFSNPCVTQGNFIQYKILQT